MIHNHNLLMRVVREGIVKQLRNPHDIFYVANHRPVVDDMVFDPKYQCYLPVVKMALVVPDVGEAVLGDAALGKTAMTSTVKLKLYTNNVTPGESDTRTTYTEATGNGYAEKAITNSNWSTVTTTGTTESTHSQQDFDFTGALGDVYGYLFATATAGILMWSEKFPTAPYNIANNGDRISITAKIQFA